MRVSIWIVVCSMILSGCGGGAIFEKNPQENALPQDTSPTLSVFVDDRLEANAELTLINFFTYLNQKNYHQASEVYGGPYDQLIGYNPSLSDEDKEGLLEAGCEYNGLMCLSVLSTRLINANSTDEYIFEVEFANPDGSLFVLGPCCGASEEEMPPVSTFNIRVRCESDGICKVLDLPPYVP